MTTLYSPEASLGSCTVELGKIVELYPETFTARVLTVSSHRDIPDVKFAMPMLQEHRGAGINFLPDIGTICYLFTPADGSGSFIMGFVYLGEPDENTATDMSGGLSYRGSRPRLNPGDISLTTSDHNFVNVKRGGVVQIGASHLAQTLYIPIENLIRHYFVRYHAMSPLGEIIWDHTKLTDESVDPEHGDVPVIMKFSCREKVQDKKMSVEVRIGHLDATTLDSSINSNLLMEGKTQTVTVLGESGEVQSVTLDAGDGDKEHLMGSARAVKGLGFEKYNPDDENSQPALLSVTINPQGEAVKYIFQVDRSGNNFLRSEANIHVEAATTIFMAAPKVRVQTSDDVQLDLEGYIKARVKEALIEILNNGDITISGKNVNLKASGTITLEAEEIEFKAGSGVSIKAPEIGLGTSHGFGSELLTGAELFKSMLENHQHGYVLSGAPAVTTPVPGVTTILPGAMKTGPKITTG